ncbi:hypothetical protein QR680_009422 [Steinernema hermaphroditum]|uniref:Large ribosomal subunit protein uL23 N-terminal domain-containing protein n=1 Tax=Steinernema hermaphroditum TaxID=289476 RepID=A0AA39IK57_9BILA|nr:hypothetical protein QR680_009422 [Steinernema hermaphroditum]
MAPKREVVKKTEKVARALDAKKKVVKGRTLQKKKIRTSVHFRRPKTLRLTRSPKYPRKSVPNRNKLDNFVIVKYPLTTESAMKKIEEHNTLVFVVDTHANKHQIKAAVKKLYNIECGKINTLVTPRHTKKAYVRLAPDFDALDVANKIGII